MPNGVSCAYFAIKNHKVWETKHDPFREGIAGCQTVRTLDAVAASNTVQNVSGFATPNSIIGRMSSAATKSSGFLKKAAGFARKIVYPLIIGSGIYNTIKADDKVKAGAMNAAGIGTMYAFEQVAEQALKGISRNLLNTKFAANHKAARLGIYIARGLTFAAASLLGYDIGSNGAEKLVNNFRENKADKQINNIKIQSDTNKEAVFQDMV